MDRRAFLQASAAAGATAALGPWMGRAAGGQSLAQPGESPYGALGAPDANGLLLPEGFTARVLAHAGEEVIDSGTEWHRKPDGGATFAASDGWVYASNSEVGEGEGGVRVLRFSADGELSDAYSILSGTRRNCAGGPTPWGTWLSCEEVEDGQVWECDPSGPGEGELRPALGVFSHEAVAVDPDGRALYLTEDEDEGRLYRFTPAAWPDLSRGVLEVAAVAADGAVRWLEVPDPTAGTERTRRQVPESTAFDGGEGIWFDDGTVVFTTKGDNRVWALDVGAQRLETLYDAAALAEPPLTGVDNIVRSANGDLYVCEDGGNMELVVINRDRVVAPFLRIVGHDESELAGAAFDPSGTRLYVSSQDGAGDGGITYEVTGPFQVPATTTTAPGPTTTLAGLGEGDDAGGDGLPVAVPLGAAAAGAALLAAGAWRRRTRA